MLWSPKRASYLQNERLFIGTKMYNIVPMEIKELGNDKFRKAMIQ